jgi:putative hemin transport protein
MPNADVVAGSATLEERWLTYHEQNPRAYLRDAATALGVSELELLLVAGQGHTVRLAVDDWSRLFAWFRRFGRVKTMTRNDHAVIERTGHYGDYQSFGAMAQVLGEIDLRIFTHEWSSAWAITTRAGDMERRSIQLYDASGDSIHKVFIEQDAAEEFDRCVDEFTINLSDTPTLTFAPRRSVTPANDDVIDVDTFLARWDAMQDTHEFHGLLREFGVTRTQALRLAGTTRARRVPPSALQHVLEGAAAIGERIMVFVGNRGIVQIYSGAIKKVVHMSGWLNVLDPGFNLHARDIAFAESWIVTKQSADGPIRSLEVYAQDGSTIVQIFGKRTEGEATPVGFGALLDSVLADVPVADHSMSTVRDPL